MKEFGYQYIRKKVINHLLILLYETLKVRVYILNLGKR